MGRGVEAAEHRDILDKGAAVGGRGEHDAWYHVCHGEGGAVRHAIAVSVRDYSRVAVAAWPATSMWSWSIHSE